ncbi:putative lipoprotein [Rhodococcus aetherivorans]|uniref:Lipoprotein n=1 Tax=Rhodococcus aetherivorans TaxID=191292 RepID=A0ABQ0YVP5_9NOCA|nr:SGNH/GDSL hydrolase family protein [Rhodococcus aetherivorans]ETT27001.1 hypothetical protein RR21198_2369 [Rhodococcus rhodochrous ATCC 21198]MDV6295445.1 SGNH/GDSL hydrolase family protein [Rhodococcus aetherivorans]GES40705.1 putative lipoprotein [Rhodococcus aetherivorans]
MKRLVDTPRALMVAALTLILATALTTASVIALRSDVEAASAPPLHIAVVGDYYTVGTQNLTVWPTLMAQRTGWAVTNVSLPGAGYAADGRGGYAFTYQVDRAQAAQPDVVLVVGGTSDTSFDPQRVAWGAGDVLGKIARGGQRALVVGPTWYETPVAPEVIGVAEIVRSAAETAGVPFLDALDPPWLTTELMRPDLTGPTDEGQSVLAARIAAWVRGEVHE